MISGTTIVKAPGNPPKCKQNAITASTLAAILSDVPARVNEAVAGIIIGRSLEDIASSLAIDIDALEELAATVNESHDNARRKFGVTLTNAHRKERAKNVASAVRNGESVPDAAKRFQVSEVHARNACRRNGVKLQVGRPRNVR